ncbi:uncharacterized protein LOC105427642 isoform X1 [Pogonomyrmex barbatus]|uniref:Uncharacterized protein LOC105427642 isoform X1 n=1 Tax=Pogonomyrmex barbatus TaxID=144034 RepID=A0A6I9WF36_9HYME|nr:uncharacterized protein LOC105427642 isoform X1 [Pogonomyrmex barbatus]XP_011637794.1 uncharacterized protein LOC105427642 isoform X1 [Pogonomyrmex barbatus]XP_011637801.1 uncharacterized protein LOC105427642 isoform X1 [Pogonomyrmex barbatus]
MNDIESFGMKGIGSKMPHSHSTPAGVDGGSRTPPATPRKAGKMLAVRVQMLDDSITMFQVQAKALGRVLFDQVCKQLHLLEADYFGLEYQEPNLTKYWLDLEKPVCRQVGLSLIDPLLRFCVKFYTPDPAQLEEEFTRYLFCLQIKRDLAQGLLQCNDNTAALMASYIVQAECGDYVIEDYPDHTYLSTYKFVPHQDQELERRIMENHKKHAGQSPAEADLNLLETARRCELYGMKMHPAKDHENVPLNLAVAHMGIVVFQNYTKINTFSWAKIRKISFKRKRFLIKLHPEGYGYYKDTVEFFFEGRNECKNFWKKCVENHGFFRCSVVKRVVRQKTRVLSRGSSFRYSGKTQKQIVEFVRDNYVKRQTFQRSNSFRQTSGGRALQGSEGGGYRGATPSSSLMGSSSISAHPLLPLGDPALATPALSLSCGSMTLDSPTTVTSVSMGGIHRREDTATSFRTLTSIDVHSPATPSQVPAQRQMHATSQQRISSTGRISLSNSSPPEFPPPRPLPRYPWQRSASCRELYASSFEDSGKARSRDDKVTADLTLDPFQLASQGELDNPITRYDESNRSYSAASSKLPSLDHDSVPERVYSSSYPGTSSLSTESGHEESGPAGDLSHDDLSHDSYELLEREHEFEYPESYSSPHDEHEPISDQSDEEIEHEMFQMDSETDSFVKHRSLKLSEKQQYKSAFTDLKNSKTKSIDRYSAVSKVDGDFVITESRIQRSGTQIERKFETRHANSVEQQSKTGIPHQDSARKDPVVMQVQKQKISVLNELKNLKPKYKITHVDSEILRDEGIMRPKSRIDDDLSPVEGNKTILDHGVKGRTTRARSIASLDDHPPRLYVETGSLGRGHKSRDRKSRDADVKIEKVLSKERRSVEKEERKRDYSRDYRRVDKNDSRERRSVDRLDSRERRSDSHGRRSVDRIDMRELRRSIERLDVREKSYEHLDSKEKSAFYYSDFYESRGKSVDRLDSQGLRSSMEYLKSPKERGNHRHADTRERRERSIERIDSRETRKNRAASIDYDQRHTLERFDSGNRSPFERLTPKEQRRMSIERLDSQKFDFDPRAIERLKSLERYEQRERTYDRKIESRSAERKSLEKLDSHERRYLGRLESREGRSLEYLDFDSTERRKNIEKTEYKDQKRSRSKIEKGKSEEKPRERDDWRSLEKARKDDERRERERQAKLSIESRTETVIGVPHEVENLKSKTVFAEYEPKVVGGIVLGFEETALPGHVPVERTKSDPNPARQRLGSNNKRHMLMHQKSIDLTPADSGDEEPFSDSAAMQKTNIDIPYTLHKRHVMNGTASDEKSESDSSKTSKNIKSLAKDLPKLPLKMVTDLPYFDLTKLSSIDKTSNKLSPDKSKSSAITTARPKSILSPSDKPKSILSPTSKLSPTDPKSIICSLSPTKRSPSKTKTQSPEKLSQKGGSLDRNRAEVIIEDYTCKKSSSLDKKPSKLSPVESNITIISALEKRSPKKSPTNSNVTIISVIQKKKSLDGVSKSPTAKTADTKAKAALNFADIVGMEMKQNLERKAKIEKDSLKAPDDSLEKQDSIEKIPLPEIPDSEKVEEKIMLITGDQIKSVEQTIKERDRSPKRVVDELSDDDQKRENVQSVIAEVHIPATPEMKSEKPPIPEKPKTLEKPSIPEKTKRILERIESKFSEVSKNSATKISRPKIIDTGFDDFVDPVADLPLDEVPVKPALELDSLKVPEFVPFMLKPHVEPLRSKSLSLAEEKAPIDTLLSPEVENKHFVQDVSPKRIKKVKSEPKKDFKKQSKSLEGDKPPLKKSASKESRAPAVSTKIDKSKLKLGEMPQEIIIIDSTDVSPEISIVQKGRSKSVTRLSDKPPSKDEKEETKTRAKSASVDDELIKGAIKSEKSRPKSLGISKSLGSTEKKDSVEKISPKRSKVVTKTDGKSAVVKDTGSKQDLKTARGKMVSKVETTSEEAVAESKQSKQEKDSKPNVKPDVVIDQPMDIKKATAVDETKETIKELGKEPRKELSKESTKDNIKKTALVQDLTQSPLVLRKPGQTPILFARARLGLSEGSGIGALQRQGATQSPTAQRRAKSLDAAVISVHRLPPANAFSSKDDTVDVSENLEDQENAAEDVAQSASAVSKLSIQMEASPNHKSDSTDHTTVPEIYTDSLSVTETSAQYLESPLTECNEIVTCADSIPYEGQKDSRIPFISPINGNDTQMSIVESAKMEEATKFIDQNSTESGAEQETSQETFEAKIDMPRDAQLDRDQSAISTIFMKSVSTIISKQKQIESPSEISDEETNAKTYETASTKSPSHLDDFCVRTEGSRSPSERDDVPDVTISAVREDEMFFLNRYDQDDPPDMVKSPIQISIEECSDDEMNLEDEEDEMEVRVEEIDEREEEENKRLDSLDTSEDTLDALDTQVQMRGADSELSSPDYGVDKMDEKTLVEVELTPEYLEMKKEDEETAEELPEDEPAKETAEIADSNRLSIDRKLRLSTERSKSEETNTWTPDREDPDSSSCSIARPLGIGQIQPIIDRREIAMIEGARNSGSLDDDNSNGSQPPPKQEMSVTWKSFPQESSGSSSLEEGWAPQDENNAQQSQSEDSNGQNEDSYQEDLADFPGTFIIGPEILANYGAFSLSRTLSRISERSTTSEQDRSDLEDSFKPSSRSPSLDDESLMSSDHQPSLSSDPPSGTALPSVSDDRRTSSELPDIPIDVVGAHEDDSKSPRTNRRSRLQLQSSEDWPSPPSSPVFETPVVSHVETFYMEIKPEEAVKVTVTDSTETPVQAEQNSDSSDENRTLHDDLHSTLLEDGQSSTSATTADGTVKIAVKPKSNSYITGSSHSEDTSMGLSMSEWSSSNNTVRQFCQYSGTKSDDNSLAELGASISDWSGSTTVIPQQYYAAADKSQSDTTTSERSATSMRPNSKCQSADTSSLPSPPSPSSLPLPVSPPLPSPPATTSSSFHQHEEKAVNFTIEQHEILQPEVIVEDDNDQSRNRGDEFDEARRFIENQFDEHHRSHRFDDEQQNIYPQEFTDISPPRITLQNEFDETIDDDFQIVPDEDTICVDDTALPIPEEDEEDQLYDNVPAMRYSSSDKVRMEVGRGDSSEDMHEKYADLTLQSSRMGDDDWSSEERRDVPEREKSSTKSTGKFDRGFSEPSPHEAGRYQGTRSTERPVVVPIRAKSTPYYSTTSLSGESTTSSPPMPIRTQIRTKTMPYSSNRSPQSEGDTSSSMDSPAHTPDRGQRAFRRKRQQNAKRRHRVVVDLEVKDGHIVSSTDSSFDVTTIPPPLLTEGQSLDVDDDEDDEMSETKDGTEHRRQQQR